MNKDLLIEKLKEDVRAQGFSVVSQKIGLSYGTLWNICASGEIKKTATLDKIEAYYNELSGVSKKQEV